MCALYVRRDALYCYSPVLAILSSLQDGCEAQARLRQEEIELLAAQLADSAAAVVKAQQSVAALEQEAALLISLEAKVRWAA